VASRLKEILAYRRAPMGTDKFRSGIPGTFKVKKNSQFGMMGNFDLLLSDVLEEDFPPAVNSEVNLIYSDVVLLLDQFRAKVADKIALTRRQYEDEHGIDSAILDRTSIKYKNFAVAMTQECRLHSAMARFIINQIDSKLDQLLALFGLDVESEI